MKAEEKLVWSMAMAMERLENPSAQDREGISVASFKQARAALTAIRDAGYLPMPIEPTEELLGEWVKRTGCFTWAQGAMVRALAIESYKELIASIRALRDASPLTIEREG